MAAETKVALAVLKQGGASSGQVLTWSGTAWGPAAASVYSAVVFDDSPSGPPYKNVRKQLTAGAPAVTASGTGMVALGAGGGARDNYCTSTGGQSNFASSSPSGYVYSTVVGGFGNSASAVANTCVGGSSHSVTAGVTSGYSFRGGGETGSVTGSYCTVLGGKSGSTSNNVAMSIGGGFSCSAGISYAAVIGGHSNAVTVATSTAATVCGGRQNTGGGPYSVTVCGLSNILGVSPVPQYSVICNGTFNQAATTATVIEGEGASSSSSYSYCRIFSSGYSGGARANGYAMSKTYDLVLHGRSSTTTLTFQRGPSTDLKNVTLVNPFVYDVVVEAVATRTGTVATSKVWVKRGLVRYNGSTVSILGVVFLDSPNTPINDAGASSWTLNVTGGAGSTLNVTITLPGGVDVRATARVRLTEVNWS